MHVYPACLKTEWSATNSEDYYAAGYTNTDIFGEQSTKLLETDFSIVSPTACNKKYQNEYVMQEGIIDEQFCAISSTSESRRILKDCKTDFGGPFQYINYTNIDSIQYGYPVVVALTSFGNGCAVAGQPSVFTKISSYISWMETVIFK